MLIEMYWTVTALLSFVPAKLMYFGCMRQALEILEIASIVARSLLVSL
jgi:hypothetical protein